MNATCGKAAHDVRSLRHAGARGTPPIVLESLITCNILNCNAHTSACCNDHHVYTFFDQFSNEQ